MAASSVWPVALAVLLGFAAASAAAGAEPAKTAKATQLEQARKALAQGEDGKAIQLAQPLIGEWYDTDLVLGALEVMAIAYGKQGDIQKELGCYEQIGGLDWVKRFTVQQRNRMLDRVRVMASAFDAQRDEELDPIDLFLSNGNADALVLYFGA
jgi:hypothetical protein